MPRAMGYLATAAAAEAALNATTYTEQAAGAQRSIVSSSANDTAAGSGAETVKITYFKLDASGAITGPFTEIVVLNGVTAVPTVSTAIALIKSIEIVTVGNGKVAAGVISLKANNDGTGATIASIAAGDRRTYLAVAYVPSGVRMMIHDVAFDSGEVATVETLYSLRKLAYGGAVNPAEIQIDNSWRVQGLSGVKQFNNGGGGQPVGMVQGPARVQLYVTPGAATAAVQRGEFHYSYC